MFTALKIVSFILEDAKRADVRRLSKPFPRFKLKKGYASVKLRFMPRLRVTLPPPHLLVTFEASGRLLSFTRAATELNITRVAVSQQIRNLEDFLGVSLFHRLHRTLKLTPVGDRYHRAISIALDQAARATTEISRVAEQKIINVTATAGFTTYWLLPNIGSFRQRHPEIELRLVISDSPLDLVDDNIDAAIRYSDSPSFPGGDGFFLMQEVISPTCAAGLVGPGTTLSAEAMRSYPLIHLEGPYDEQTRWSYWFHAQGFDWHPSPGGISVNTYTNLVQATLDGQGFALIGPPLVDRYLSSGALVQPVAAPPIKRRAFYLVTPRSRRASNAASLFHDWILDLVREGNPQASG